MKILLFTILCLISVNLFASEISNNQVARVQRLSRLRREDIAEHMTELYSHIFSVEDIQMLSERFSCSLNDNMQVFYFDFVIWELQSNAQEDQEEFFNREAYDQVKANLHIFDELGWGFAEGNGRIGILLRNARNIDELNNIYSLVWELIINAGIILNPGDDISTSYTSAWYPNHIDNVLESISSTRANIETPQ